ncbi:hypothetical protein ALO82_102890 [Pseudomonas syringae pv. broussonetiae]|uniref:Uncharacterized protein n=1 Tax=Pseudomonas savastanoi TaxID=29438 RepID=A0A3M5BRI7_PSESS|nr:hypothetical protein ALO82_102890 [Pseudomonas syringae pv. broussonetiae]RMS27899.1 hypothetical protein ALP70_103131 [Pseudomonas savastanoi]RMT33510.1 hypothetical protein ALP51_103081 [Pseudomonas savastanoi]
MNLFARHRSATSQPVQKIPWSRNAKGRLAMAPDGLETAFAEGCRTI